MQKKRNRVIFYSKQDLSAGRNLENAELVIKNFNHTEIRDINDIIELYQVKLYFDNDLYLNKWTEETKIEYTKIVSTFFDIIRQYWSKINDQSVLNLFDTIEFEFYDSFWSLVNIFSTYKQIKPQTLNQILKSNRFNIRHLLKRKNIVNHFSKPITDYLIVSEESAEILLSHYEQEHSFHQPDIYFPAKLKDSDKELIISNYLDSPNANLNYVRLAAKSRSLKLTDKTRLKAERLSQKINNDILETGSSWKKGVQVEISKDQIEPIKIEYKEHRLTYSYSENWLNVTKSPVGVFQNFIILFKYINNQGCINLVSKNCEIDSFERTLIRSKNEYFISSKFYEKDSISNLQLVIYLHYLNKNELLLEDILSYQVNEVLNEKYDIKGLKILFPSQNTSAYEKIRILAPELEFLIKQYKSYTEDGFIDSELIQFSSSPLHLSNVKSKTKRKYAYGQGDEFFRIKHYFFSDQSMLFYIDPHKGKYRSFYHLLKNEQVKYGDFEGYQKLDIDYLLSKEYLFKDTDNTIKIKNEDLIFVIGVLHFEDVINFWHHSQNIRKEILELEKKKLIKFENTLFTIEERNYLNYYLNQKFSNGLDLRNKYLHGTNSSSQDDQQYDYYVFLKLLILIILKIKDDLSIYKLIQETNANDA